MAEEQTVQLKKLLNESPGGFFLAGHYFPDRLPLAAQIRLEDLLRARKGAIYIAGHEHYDELRKYASREIHIVRGLDPDKAIGGPPAITLFEYEPDTGNWHREEVSVRFED